MPETVDEVAKASKKVPESADRNLVESAQVRLKESYGG
mgnify:CR=1 FL=1